jgi:cytochrome oxidase assembly protein ShyY1
VYRFLVKPRWLGLELLAIVVAIVFVLLGRWQYHSAHQVSRAVAAPVAATASPLQQLVRPGSELKGQVLGAGVTVTGTFDPTSQRLVPDQVSNGRTGWWVVTLLRPTDGAAAVLVARGWVATGVTRVPAPPPGRVRVLGWLGASQDPGEAAAAPSMPHSQLPAVSPAVLADQVSYPVGDGFIGATAVTALTGSGAPAAGLAGSTGLAPVGLPAGGVSWDWENLGYAIQWCFFAVAVFGVLAFGARREALASAQLAVTALGRTEITL